MNKQFSPQPTPPSDHAGQVKRHDTSGESMGEAKRRNPPEEQDQATRRKVKNDPESEAQSSNTYNGDTIVSEELHNLNNSIIGMTSIINEAAKQHLTKKEAPIKKDYITKETEELIQLRQSMRNNHTQGLQIGDEWIDDRSLTKKIKKSIKKDKKNNLLDSINKGEWAEIKYVRKGFMPKFVRLTDSDGHVLESAKRPDALADFFEDKIWGGLYSEAEKEHINPNDRFFGKDVIYPEPAVIRTDPYDMTELKRVLRKMKKKKTPGPDLVSMDMFKIMDDSSLEIVLKILNKAKNVWIPGPFKRCRCGNNL